MSKRVLLLDLLERGEFLLMLIGLIASTIFVFALRGLIVYPDSLQLGIVSIRFYAVAILVGIFSVAHLVQKFAPHELKLKKVDIQSALVWIILPAIVGARLWHIATDFYLYQTDPLAVLYIWNGGLGIAGGLLGGLAGYWLFCRKYQLDWLKILEVIAVFLPLGQVIGRFGNFFNQELYGPKTDLPWGWWVYDRGNYQHPNFLYEQVGNLLLFGILWQCYRTWGISKAPRLWIIYLVGYSIVRFLTDFLRPEPRVFYGFTVAQMTGILLWVIIFCLCLWSVNRQTKLHT